MKSCKFIWQFLFDKSYQNELLKLKNNNKVKAITNF